MKRSRKGDAAATAKATARTLKGSAYWRAEFMADFKELTHRNRPEKVFGDFVEMAAITISNAVDPRQAPDREVRYLALINSYTHAEDRHQFPKLLAHLTLALDAEMHDALGSIWMELDLGDGWKGQYFTPYHVSHMMARMTFHDCQAIIDKHGFISASEPACGPGGMIVAMAHAMHEMGINYQQTLHVHGIDIDARCAHMAYIQASLLGIPAIITVGDTLRWVLREHWFTPMHVLGDWGSKLAFRDALDAVKKLMLEAPAETISPELDLAAIGRD